MWFLLLFSALLFSCNWKGNNSDDEKKGGDYYQEQYRPQFHFSPEANWMNDPNGLVWLDGEFHLFYQYYPDSTVWGPMHWGHAVSSDMVHWKHLPIALFPDSLGYIFSGSAVVDTKNSSDLGTDQNRPVVAIFTYHDPMLERSGSSKFQNQGITYSNDKGRTWTKYAGNPVLKNPGIRDFRDPKVFWHEGSERWIMILAVHDRVHLYSSPNLKEWTFESEFGKDTGAHTGVWECPDLFRLNVEGSDISKWVMLVSINPGGPNGGSATQYFVGDFDGHRFVSEDTKIRWIDWGRDNYAGVTWSNVPEIDGRRLFIGWMSNWDYATKVPTNKWRSAMTVPRELYLASENNSSLLMSRPAKEIEKLRRREIPFFKGLQSNIAGKEGYSVDLPLMQSELFLDFDLRIGSNDSILIILENDLEEKLVITYNGNISKVIINRIGAGNSSFSDKFASVISAPFNAGAELKLHLFVDAASTELFVNDGRLVMTNLIFPSEGYARLRIFPGQNNILKEAKLYNLENIWQ